MTFNSDKVAIQDLRIKCKLGEKEMMRVILGVVNNHQEELELAAAQYIIDEATSIESIKQTAKAQKDAVKAAAKELRDAERAAIKAQRAQENMQKAAQKAADKANKEAAKAAELAAKVIDVDLNPANIVDADAEAEDVAA